MEPWEHHQEDSWPPWILMFLLQPKNDEEEEAKEGDDLENAEV
jgi:hypothetical protein